MLTCELLLAGACGIARKFSPDTVYQEAWLKVKRGDLTGGRADVDTALKNLPRSDREWNLRFTELKAEILVRQRLTEEALGLLAEPLPLRLGNSDLAVWRKLTEGMARIYSRQLDDGERVLGEAENLARLFHPELLGEVALRQGTLAFLRGNAEDAESAYRKALDLARSNQDAFLETAALGSLGLTAIKQERYDQSIGWNEQALALSRQVGAKDSESYTLGNMGWGYFEIGDYDRALEALQEAEESSRKAGSVGAQIDWLIEIGGVEYYLREYAAAERESQKALALARQISDMAAVTASLNNLSAVALKRADVPQAERYNDEALAISQSSHDVSGQLSSGLLQGRIESRKGNYRAAEHLLEQVSTDSGAETSLRWEAQARLAAVYREAHLDAKAERAYRQSIGTVGNARSSIQDEELRVAFLSNAIEFYDDYVNFLVDRGRKRDALEVAELSRARTLAEGLGVSRKPTLPLPDFRPQEISRRANATVLFYWLGETRSHLWVITPMGLSCVSIAPAAEIDAGVKAYQEAVLGGRDVLRTGNGAGEKLYELLIAPAKKLIRRGGRVILLPDGSLYGLNFEALVVAEPKPHFWIEDVTLATASSLSLLSSAHAGGTSKRDGVLVVGNAVATKDFPVLRQAANEIESVRRHFSETRREVLAGAQATPVAYLGSQPERFAYLHFVTHGTASRAHPLESAVILSPEGKDPASYKLYARDIVEHPLSAYLVTISACNGSGTRAYSGEGLVGLSWAFLRAGARNVIAALWEVNDASTPQLMDRLYAELSEGKDPATALRAAKLSLLHSDGVFQKPFYWAPFQIYTGPQSEASRSEVPARRNAD